MNDAHDSTRPGAGGLPPTIGRFRVLARLGEGGMAEVFRAEDPSLSRQVAIKVLSDRSSRNERIHQRFLREARSLARLSHPNLVKVLEVGEEEIGPYLVMELVEGLPLDEVLAGPAVDRPALFGALARVARAVDHAHGVGIVHRDLKPSNLLIGADGEPKVVDFGLAHVDEGGTALTRSEAVLGTPRYMAPEQVAGGSAGIGPWTDVHALGSILFEIATGRPPFEGRTTHELYHQILETAPQRPRRIDPSIPIAIETIALVALEKDPALRYRSASDLADDLERHLRDEPIAARPVPAIVRGWRRSAGLRAALVVAGLVTTAALVALLIGLTTVLARRGRIDQAMAEAAALEAEERHEEAETAYRQVLDWAPGHDDAASGLARVEAARAAGEEAAARDRALGQRLGVLGAELDVLEALLGGPPGDDEELLRRAGDASEALVGLVANAPDRSDLHEALGRAQRLQGRRVDAIASWTKALALDPGRPALRGRLGRARLEKALLHSTWLADASDPTAPRLVEAAIDLEASGVEIDQRIARAARALATGDLATPLRLADEVDEGEGIEYLLVVASHAAQKGERAIALLDRALELRPRFALARVARGACRQVAGDPTGARADFEAALRIDPRLAVAYVLRGLLRFAASDFEGAIADYDRALRLEPDEPRILCNRANARYKSGDVVGAMTDYDRALEIEPGLFDALSNRGVVLLQLGRPDEALTDFEAALALDRTRATAWFHRGNAWAELGRPDRARADYDETLALDPRHYKALVNRANARGDLGDPEGAIADYRAAIAIAPTFAEAWFNLGNLHNDRGETDQAIEAYSEAVRVRPDFAFAYYNRANVKSRLEDIEGAIEDYTRAIRHAPGFHLAYLNRGNLRMTQERPEEALEDFGHAIRIEPGRPGAWANRGALRLRLGDRAGAAADLEQALAVAPADWPSRARTQAILDQLRGR